MNNVERIEDITDISFNYFRKRVLHDWRIARQIQCVQLVGNYSLAGFNRNKGKKKKLLLIFKRKQRNSNFNKRECEGN